jgi:hypothetical protein
MASLATSDRTFFVSNDDNVVDTLFSGPVTASGTFKVRKNGVVFYDLQGIARVFLCANPGSDPFFVSCSYCTTKSGRRSLRYMNALCSLDELFMGIRGYTEETYLASSLWRQANQS